MLLLYLLLKANRQPLLLSISGAICIRVFCKFARSSLQWEGWHCGSLPVRATTLDPAVSLASNAYISVHVKKHDKQLIYGSVSFVPVHGLLPCLERF